MSGASLGPKRKGKAALQAAQPVPAELAVGGLALVPPPVARLDPSIGLREGGRHLGENAHVRDFWSWAFSDLRQNNVRGHLAEYIVGVALDVPLTVRSSWDDYDLLVPAGKLGRGAVRVQVKSAAYLQAWGQRKLSAITPLGGCAGGLFPGLPVRASYWARPNAPRRTCSCSLLKQLSDTRIMTRWKLINGFFECYRRIGSHRIHSR
jgi:hypothetical protein